MDQNDFPPTGSDFKWRNVTSFFDEGRLRYVSLACMHCHEAPCAPCPTGAIVQNTKTGFVETDQSKCIGCRVCAEDCPFDVPKFDEKGKIQKCDGCAIRVAHGYEPACVKICPTRALKTRADHEKQTI
jgi:Fe-S-cluster-containing dehydrogenase component